MAIYNQGTPSDEQIQDYAENTGFGSGANRTKFDENGTLIMEGDATVWDDIQTSLIGRRLYSNQGTVDYDYDENAVVFSQNGGITDVNDRIGFNLQLRHGTVDDSTMMLHMHYQQTSADNLEFTIRYRIQNNGQAKNTTWTTVTANTDDSIWTWSSGTLNNILSIADIDLTGNTISAVVEIQMTRTDSEGGTVAVTFVDAHLEADQLGSNEEFVK